MGSDFQKEKVNSQFPSRSLWRGTVAREAYPPPTPKSGSSSRLSASALTPKKRKFLNEGLTAICFSSRSLLNLRCTYSRFQAQGGRHRPILEARRRRRRRRGRRRMDGVVRRSSRGMLPFLALNVANEFYRLERKPPVTAGLLLANTLIYLRPGVLDALLPTIDEVWFNPHIIVKNRDLKRFFLSAFYHMGESHLVYNMLSLLWKGVQLEISMGSVDFASMVAALLAMSQGITLALAKMLVLFDYDKAYYQEYAVGFSGVLFAMKVVLNSQSDDYTYVHGLIVPSRYAAWAELVLIQMFVPGVSFLGHLGGILAGMLYLHFRGERIRSDPLTILLRKVVGVLSRPVRYIKDYLTGQRRRTFGRGSVGRTRSDAVWRCPVCTFDNAVSLRRCEMCETPREGGAFPTNRNRELSAEELRRRRLERFSS